MPDKNLYKAAVLAALLIAAIYTGTYVHSEYRISVAQRVEFNNSALRWCYEHYDNASERSSYLDCLDLMAQLHAGLGKTGTHQSLQVLNQ